MKYTLIANVNGIKFSIDYKTLSEARKALREKVVHAGKDYISKLPPPQLIIRTPNPRSKKTEEHLEKFYMENYVQDYYVLYDRQDIYHQKMVISGTILKEGEKLDGELDIVYE